jgi:hypothetical protein
MKLFAFLSSVFHVILAPREPMSSESHLVYSLLSVPQSEVPKKYI